MRSMLPLIPLLCARVLSAQSIALTHVNVVEMQRGSILRDQTVVIADGRIASVGPTSGATIPRGTVQRSYRGRYVIPGLWDMHAHLGMSGRNSLGLYLANGVTGVRDMGGDHAMVVARRDSVVRHLLPGPRMIMAGGIVERAAWLKAVMAMSQKAGDTESVNRLSERLPVSTPESARRAVDSVIALGGDFLKIRNDASAASTFELLRYAREKHLPVTGHWPQIITPEQASDSGYSSLEHGPLTARNGTLVPTLDLMTPTERSALFARFAKNGTAHTPTLITLKGFRLTPDSTVARILADTAGRREPRMRYVPGPLLRTWRSQYELTKQETGPPLDWAAFDKSWSRDLREMADSGVLLLAGTDVGSPLVFPGFSVADELELLVIEGRLTTLQSLRTATSNVAKWMHAENDFGTVAPGQRADLVVLDADPLANIANVRRITAVVRDGRLMDRPALDRLLAGARRR
jgi:imidazolonepropionase-like amidohydrolase